MLAVLGGAVGGATYSHPMKCALGCGREAETDAPLPLCTMHLLAAHDWVVRESGVTDLLPSPCVACGSRVGVRYPSGWICATCEWRVGETPEQDTVPRVDVVYYLRFRTQVKIGTTNNPHARFAALPHDEVLAFERGGRALEQRRHAQFAEHRIPRTEWFHANDDLEHHIAALREGVDDPWDKHRLWLSQEIALRG